MDSLGIVAYLALFAGVGLIFVLANLLIGWFLRPNNPSPEKSEIYECGEPTIGSSFVQFDLRFYVVALLFIIFDVEVAFFFPWATVFGKANNLSDPAFQVVSTDGASLTPGGDALYQELGIRNPEVATNVPESLVASFETRFGKGSAVGANELTPAQARFVAAESGKQLMLVTLFDILAFFAILMVGFAYVWRRGDLDWVKAVAAERSMVGNERSIPQSEVAEQEPIISA